MSNFRFNVLCIAASRYSFGDELLMFGNSTKRRASTISLAQMRKTVKSK